MGLLPTHESDWLAFRDLDVVERVLVGEGGGGLGERWGSGTGWR